MAAVSVNRSILKDCSVVCLEAKEAIFVNLLTEKSFEFLGINYWLKAMPFFYQKIILPSWWLVVSDYFADCDTGWHKVEK